MNPFEKDNFTLKYEIFETYLYLLNLMPMPTTVAKNTKVFQQLFHHRQNLNYNTACSYDACLAYTFLINLLGLPSRIAALDLRNIAQYGEGRVLCSSQAHVGTREKLAPKKSCQQLMMNPQPLHQHAYLAFIPANTVHPPRRLTHLKREAQQQGAQQHSPQAYILAKHDHFSICMSPLSVEGHSPTASASSTPCRPIMLRRCSRFAGWVAVAVAR
jgi:hypothetical protein